MTKKQKNVVKKAIISGLLLVLAYLFKTFPLIQLAVFITAYLVIGLDVLKKSFRNICKGQIFDENFLMSLATLGAFAIGDFGEAVFVMLFYKVGELFESITVGKSRKSISDLMEICPEYANLEKDGEVIIVDPSELVVGDIIVVKPGEKISVDGVVIEGESGIDTANLTGESVPRWVSEGDHLISGCINTEGVLRVRVEKEFRDSTVSKILDLVENASSKKSVSETFITKFAKYYTPIVVVCALLLAVIPPIFFGAWQEWLHRALIFLVVSCPCALVISVPLSFFCGIGCASRQGILIKGSNYIEALSRCKAVAFDKTGTLTKGRFQVVKVCPQNISEDELLKIAAHAEYYSTHPVAVSICKAYTGGYETDKISEVNEIAGHGVKLILDGKSVVAGNELLMQKEKVEVPRVAFAGTAVHLAIGGKYLGYIVVADEIKEDAKLAMTQLRSCGTDTLTMLSGDKKVVAEQVGEELGLDEVYSELLPADKVSALEKLMEKVKKSKASNTLAYVGDGVNDAPVLSRADIGIAMGAMGSDAAIEAADVVLMNDSIKKVPIAIQISKKTLGIVKQNVVFALSVKFLVLILSTYGLSNMWEAAFADVGVSVIAILNAMRILKYKR